MMGSDGFIPIDGRIGNIRIHNEVFEKAKSLTGVGKLSIGYVIQSGRISNPCIHCRQYFTRHEMNELESLIKEKQKVLDSKDESDNMIHHERAGSTKT